MTLALIAFLFLPPLLNQTALAQNAASLQDRGAAGQKPAPRRLNVKFVSACSRDAYQNPEAALDGDPGTEFTFVWGNGGADIVLDLGEPTEVESLEIVSGSTGGPFFLSEVNVGPASREPFARSEDFAYSTPDAGEQMPHGIFVSVFDEKWLTGD